MAPQKEKNEPKNPTQALAPRQANTAMAVAEDVDRSDYRGKENIKKGDISLPRLAVAQKTNPQLEADRPEYLEGLKKYDLFNTLTGDIYGNGPVEFVIVRHEKKAMQFDDANNVVDPNVPIDFDEATGKFKDARLNFNDKPNGGKPDKPIATLFHEYLIVLADTLSPAVLSLKGTGLKAAKQLNGLIQVRPGAIWSGKYRVTSAKGNSAGFDYGVYKIVPAGPASPELRQMAEEVYETLKGRTIHTDRDGADEAAPVNDDKVPF